MKNICFLIFFITYLQLTHQQNQNVLFFDYPMLWTKYVILNTASYQGNNIYTFDVSINGINVSDATTGVTFAGFNSQVTQNFKFRMNEYFKSGIQSYITLNWTVLSPSAFNYLSFSIVILQNEAQYLQLIKFSYSNASGLYDGSDGNIETLILIPQETKLTLSSADKIYSFITSVQMMNNKGPYAWPIYCYSYYYGTYQCGTSYTWDILAAYTFSGMYDLNHIYARYGVYQWTWLYEMYTIQIIFHNDQYNKDHDYPYLIDYKDNFDLRNNYIPSNMDARYGPSYDEKCLFGQNYLPFGRFYPQLLFYPSSNGFTQKAFYEQNNYVIYSVDFICLRAFKCNQTIVFTYQNSTNFTNSSNNTINPENQTIINSFYFPAYKNCSTCTTKIIGATSCSQVEYCISCVQAYDIPRNWSCVFCTACNTYAYVLDTGFCQACNNTFEGCQKCTTNAYNSCTKCFVEYYINASLCYLCNTTMILCITCNSSSICTECYSPDDTYYLNSSTNLCTLCSIPLSRCLNCYNETACLQCQSDHYYVDELSSHCLPCNTTDIFCVTCLNQTYCLTCIENYIPDQNATCQFCDFFTKNCSECTNDTTCLNCSITFFLDYTGQCSICPEYITGCYECDYNDTCKTCFQDYVLETDFLCYYCALYIDECVICKNQTYCINCSYGYYVNSNFTCTNCNVPMQYCVECLVDNLCLDCIYGYYPEAQKCLLCKSQMSQCLDCINSSFCLQCTSDFIPINGTCKCRQGYLVTQVCNIILGCVSNHYISGVKRCLACNATANFTYSHFNCKCKQGYSITGVNQNAACGQICGDGKIIYLSCDDGNLFDGDGCSSQCTIEPGYICQNGTFWSSSVCSLITNFAVSLYSIKRQDTQNSGIVRLKIIPTQSRLKIFQWENFVNFNIFRSSVNNRMLNVVPINVTGITYNEGIASINFNYFETIQHYNAQIDIIFDPQLFKAEGKSLQFSMLSMNSPLTYEDYLNHHQILIILFYVVVSLGLLQFLVCLKTKSLVGVQTLQVLQFFFFVKLLTDENNPSLPYMNYPLFYANGFNFILSNQGRNYNMEMGLARLNLQPQFVLNINLSFLILLIFFFVRLYYQIVGVRQQANFLNKTSKEIKETVKKDKEKVKNIYQNFILPVCLINIFLIIFSVASKFSIRNAYQTQVPRWLQCLAFMSAIPSFFFVYFVQMKSLFDMPLLESWQEVKDQNCQFQESYVPFNIMFYMTSAIVIFSCKNQSYGLYIEAGVCLIYLVYLIFFTPYKKNYNNIGVILNQIVVICCLGFFCYINFFDQSLTVVLISMYGITGMLFFITFYGYFRIYYAHKYRRAQKTKFSKKQDKTKQEILAQSKLKKKKRAENPYLYENQLKAEQERNNSKQKLIQRNNQNNTKKISFSKQKEDELQMVKDKLKESLRKKRINQTEKIFH